jgi:hypothetical protein
MQGELRPHKVRYYVERRDPEFASKMAAVLHVYIVALLSEASSMLLRIFALQFIYMRAPRF